eukprot:10903804-Alexandrium_andersonii.AAC.1
MTPARARCPVPAGPPDWRGGGHGHVERRHQALHGREPGAPPPEHHRASAALGGRMLCRPPSATPRH